MNRKLLGWALIAGLLSMPLAASAHTDIQIGIGLPVPLVYAAPRPYCPPPPVYYAPPPPPVVYYEPAPVYYGPPAYGYGPPPPPVHYRRHPPHCWWDDGRRYCR